MSTVCASTIQTANGTTDLTLTTGNNTGPAIIIGANGSLVYNNISSFSVNTVSVGSNVSLNTTALFIGNSTVNTVITSASSNSITVNGLAVGYLEIPPNSKSQDYTTVLTDSGKHILHPSSDNNARTFTIANNSSVPYPIGTALTFINAANTLTISINNDTMYLAGTTGTTGNRTLGSYGISTAIKISSTIWIINGTNLT